MSKTSLKIFLLIALISFSQASWISNAWNKVKNGGKNIINKVGDIAKSFGKTTKKVWDVVIKEARELGLIEIGKTVASAAFNKQCVITCMESLGLGEHACKTECELITEAIDDKVLDNINFAVEDTSSKHCSTFCGDSYMGVSNQTAEDCLNFCLSEKEVSHSMFQCFGKCESVQDLGKSDCRDICTNILLK